MKSLTHLLSYLVLLLLPALYIAPSNAGDKPDKASDLSSAKKTDDKQSAKGKKAAPTIESLLADRQFVQGEKTRGIRTYTIDTWRYLDKYHIYIDGVGRSHNYLVKFKHKCRDARGSEALFYKTHNGELTKFDSIAVIDNIGGSHSMPSRHCFIEAIYHLNRIEETADNTVDDINKNATNGGAALTNLDTKSPS